MDDTDTEWDHDELELGERAAWWLLMWELSNAYTTQHDRERGAVLNLIGSVAPSTSHVGEPYPIEWWPIDQPIPEYVR